MGHTNLPQQEPPTTSSSTKKAPLDWRRAHEELSQLGKARAHLDWEEGGALLRALRSGVHLHLGFGSFAEYVERLLGYGPRWREERLRAAEALEGLPDLDQSLRTGLLGWSAARELTRVATPQSERQWIEFARGRTIRQIETLVAGRKLGDLPTDPADASRLRHVLRFDVSAETLATFREAMAKLRRDADASLDDDAVLLLLARHVLGGPAEPGRASYQIAITTCGECKRSRQDGRGEQVELGTDAVEMAACDAQHIGEIQAPATRSTHVGSGVPSKPHRAHQDVPPAIRREVIRRDGGRCVVPGCRHAVFVDIHHLTLRSEGGDHDPDQLIVLCAAHHRAQHRGQLIIEGRMATGLVFRHADGSDYGAVVNPAVADTHERAFRALRGLGFHEGETRRALERVRIGPHVGEVSMDRVMRETLALLTASTKSIAQASSMP